MRTDAEIRTAGVQALLKALGALEAERFVTLILREPFDYTRWQRDLWTDKSVEEISRAAMRHRNAERPPSRRQGDEASAG